MPLSGVQHESDADALAARPSVVPVPRAWPRPAVPASTARGRAAAVVRDRLVPAAVPLAGRLALHPHPVPARPGAATPPAQPGPAGDRCGGAGVGAGGGRPSTGPRRTHAAPRREPVAADDAVDRVSAGHFAGRLAAQRRGARPRHGRPRGAGGAHPVSHSRPARAEEPADGHVLRAGDPHGGGAYAGRGAAAPAAAGVHGRDQRAEARAAVAADTGVLRAHAAPAGVAIARVPVHRAAAAEVGAAVAAGAAPRAAAGAARRRRGAAAVAARAAGAGVPGVLRGAADPAPPHTRVRERAGMRDGGAGPRRGRLARRGQLPAHLIAGHQDRAVFRRGEGAVAGSRGHADRGDVAAEADSGPVGATERGRRARGSRRGVRERVHC